MIETLPLRSPAHRSIFCYEGTIWVADYATRELYMYGQVPGTPGPAGDIAGESGEAMPTSIRLTWTDPDTIPSWTQIRIYRDGLLHTTVPPGAEEYTDGGLEEHSYHHYFLAAYRPDDGIEGMPSDTVGCYAGTRPPITIRVPEDSPSIQAAIYAGMDEDTILVSSGTYNGPIRFMGRNIVVRSASGPTDTILDCQDRPFSIATFDSTENRGAVLSGFTLRGAQPWGTGVVYCGPRASPTIEGNVITGNTIWSSGGAIVCDSDGTTSPLIRSNTIALNRMLADMLPQFVGGGIYCRSAPAQIDQNIVAYSEHAYGIYAEGSFLPVLSCNDLWSNGLGRTSGAIPESGTSPSIRSSATSPGTTSVCAGTPRA